MGYIVRSRDSRTSYSVHDLYAKHLCLAIAIAYDYNPRSVYKAFEFQRQLGRPMNRGYTNYPGYSGTYGRRNLAVDGGAPEALRGWTSGLYFPKVHEVKTERDFLSMNRCAVEAGLVTAREHQQFRAGNDIRRKVVTDEVRRPTDKSRRMPPSFVYGVATRWHFVLYAFPSNDQFTEVFA